MKQLLALLSLSYLALADTLTLPAQVVAKEPRTLTSRTMGFVKAIHVAEGQQVSKGTLLYEVDAKEIDTQRVQVELAISQAQLAKQMHQNQLHLTQRNLERHQRLYAKEMVAKVEVEALELAVQNLEAMVAIAQKQVAQATSQLQTLTHQYTYLRITAPSDGVVTKKFIQEGEMALPGAPALLLVDTQHLEIHTDLPERYFGQVHSGQMLLVEIPSLGLRGQGKVSALIPVTNGHSFKLKITLPEGFTGVQSGMHARVTLP